MLLADVDAFKGYNDTYGHPRGDTVLVAAARAIDGTLNRPGDLVFRIGGDEFACLFTTGSPQESMALATHICERMALLAIEHEGNVPHGRVTLSARPGADRPGRWHGPGRRLRAGRPGPVPRQAQGSQPGVVLNRYAAMVYASPMTTDTDIELSGPFKANDSSGRSHDVKAIRIFDEGYGIIDVYVDLAAPIEPGLYKDRALVGAIIDRLRALGYVGPDFQPQRSGLAGPQADRARSARGIFRLRQAQGMEESGRRIRRRMKMCAR
ncbi:GGDEF domain-containing protein [Massilia sp. H-1]|nr:GGDEF domain-containing protein [Massilia sp. H-1]